MAQMQKYKRVSEGPVKDCMRFISGAGGLSFVRHRKKKIRRCANNAVRLFDVRSFARLRVLAFVRQSFALSCIRYAGVCGCEPRTRTVPVLFLGVVAHHHATMPPCRRRADGQHASAVCVVCSSGEEMG